MSKSKEIIIAGSFVLLLIVFASLSILKNEPVTLSYPSYWPEPTYDFSNNNLTSEGIYLGRRLFYDPILSKDSSISCSSCHLSYTAFTHIDHALSHGIQDRIGTRNSAALINLAWNKSFMWDGAVNHLDMQALAPISHPSEMGESIQNVVKKLHKTNHYRQLFKQAFGDSKISGERILKALSQFELTLISKNSKYDSVMANQKQFTTQESNGYLLFQNHCADCHIEPLFTNDNFKNNGLQLDSTLNDFGRMLITSNPKDSLKFKVPTLRNIEFSAPYMHDGRFKKLSQVINHYVDSFNAPNLSDRIVLSDTAKADLIAFLFTLSDKQFLFNSEFAYPRE
ncbi:MAG: cytochrome c peroxidase [Flavobacteriales bacterium]|nr:cytochrome c peroxidase [Flavobacteriales bacterium]